jgi:hypothetical protein
VDGRVLRIEGATDMAKRTRRHSESLEHEPAAERFLRLARRSRAQELRALSLLVALVAGIGGLVHALQRERGTSSIFLASGGASFAAQRAQCVGESLRHTALVLEHLTQLAGKPDALAGSRFYLRAARGFRQLAALAVLRERIAAQGLDAQDAVQAFSEVIADLLTLSFESADIAADPAISRAMVALASFSQAKELAGQERATAGALFSRGQSGSGCRERLRHLVNGQERAFGVFREFAGPGPVLLLDAQLSGGDWTLVERMRAAALEAQGNSGISADAWYEAATRRIDALKTIEDAMTAALGELCARILAEPPPSQGTAHRREDRQAGAPLALLISDADPAANGLGLDGGIGFYAFEGALPRPLRSILDVLDAQSRRISDVSSQLDAARSELSERKVIERAKGLLMKAHQLTESRAYALMREMAMSQNKRLIEVAEAIIGMAERLRS